MQGKGLKKDRQNSNAKDFLYVLTDSFVLLNEKPHALKFWYLCYDCPSNKVYEGQNLNVLHNH